TTPPQPRSADPLATDLDDHPAGMRPHQLGTGTAFTRDQVGVAKHRFNNAECGMRSAELLWRVARGTTFAPRLRIPHSELRTAQSPIRQRHVPQRDPEA